jgi:hypothetical protein
MTMIVTPLSQRQDEPGVDWLLDGKFMFIILPQRLN